MPATASLKPLAAGRFGYAQARHLLNRAGFGGTPQQIGALRDMGLAKAVDHLVDYQSVDGSSLTTAKFDPDIMVPATRQQRQQMRQARQGGDEQQMAIVRRMRNERRGDDRDQMAKGRRWWLGRMIQTPRPLEEKLTLFWHGHFASNHRTVRDSYLMLQQNELFRKHANGSFADLATAIVRNPAMIRFLNNDSNRKGKPNENLARELMELFTLGEGNYSEKDIKEGARALTGFTYHDNKFQFNRRRHDEGMKVLLGQRGHFNGDDFVRLCLGRPSCSEFISYKLYRQFASDIPGGLDDACRSVIRQLAAQIRKQDYQLRPVLNRLFKSEHFYDPTIVGNMVKSPVQLVVGSLRVLKTPSRDEGMLLDAMSLMGQRLFDPPSVAGWAGGRTWVNTSTLLVRQNLATLLISGKLPFEAGWDRDQMNYDPTFLVDDLADPTPRAVVDRLVTTLLDDRIDSQRRDELVAFVEKRSAPLGRDSQMALLLLLTAMPEYQLH